jgi:tripartite-type tricarboxylate transporter receptor subunit TctC
MSQLTFILRPSTFLLAIAVTLSADACAQAYPAKLIRLVTGSSAGGAADITAWQVASQLSESLKQQIIVDNRPGVAGMLANEFVLLGDAKAEYWRCV